MKAVDLIRELEKFPKDKEVRVFSEKDSIPFEITRVFHNETFAGDFSFLVIDDVKE